MRHDLSTLSVERKLGLVDGSLGVSPLEHHGWVLNLHQPNILQTLTDKRVDTFTIDAGQTYTTVLVILVI